MFGNILKKLTEWRNETARREGVDLFRVLPNKTLEELARVCPLEKSQMIGIKGIKELKFKKYGKEILKIIKDSFDVCGESTSENNKDNLHYFQRKMQKDKLDDVIEEKIYSVSEFWDGVNKKLGSLQVKIRGEISSVDIRSSAVYFSLKDKKDESVMNCFIFRYQYDILAVDIKEGMEVLIQGYPEVYKTFGRLSLRTNVIELEGEGMLKKEYEMLKRMLENEGFFDLNKKKVFKQIPRNIGLITSRDGAAIGDFTSNIGKYGLKIKFVNSSVEGKRAVFELINAIKHFKKVTDLDALVIIRGGGSLESLQAFNNEALIRTSKTLKVPVICGVGHDKDISLLSLAADFSVSTPTAAAKLIGEMWEREIEKIEYYGKNIFRSYEESFTAKNHKIDNCLRKIEWGFQNVLRETEIRYDGFLGSVFSIIENNLRQNGEKIEIFWDNLCCKFENRILIAGTAIEHADNVLKLNNPRRQLRMGYGIISKNGKSIKSVNEIQKNDRIKMRLSDGEAMSLIKEVKKFKK
jgi:exodeoxyribonuclease VII large subunit